MQFSIFWTDSDFIWLDNLLFQIFILEYVRCEIVI
jgi:hypothetical protein